MHPTYIRSANAAARVLTYQRRGWRQKYDALLAIDKYSNYINPFSLEAAPRNYLIGVVPEFARL